MTSLPSGFECAQGYFEIGMWNESWNELENMAAECQCHPSVLWLRLKILMGLKDWEKARILGESLCKLWPSRAEFVLDTAFVIEAIGQPEQAKAFLKGAHDQIWSHAEAWYSLACITAKLGDLEGAKQALESCFCLNKDWSLKALHEPALQVLW
jgi:predicted Zn-dependent protease